MSPEVNDARRQALRVLDDRLTAAPGRWSVAVVDAADGTALSGHQPDDVLPTASSAKVLVLLAAALGIAAGTTSPDTMLHRDSAAPVADSGLWQHLRADTLALDDVAQLIGSVSDNLATNVLIAHLGGIDQIARAAEDLGIRGVRLHDIVRDERMPQHPPTLSTGSAADYADLFARLWRRGLGGDAMSERVLKWLAHGTDLSMVAAAFGLDRSRTQNPTGASGSGTRRAPMPVCAPTPASSRETDERLPTRASCLSTTAIETRCSASCERSETASVPASDLVFVVRVRRRRRHRDRPTCSACAPPR